MVDQTEAFDLSRVTKGWSEKLKAADVETKGRGRPASGGGGSKKASGGSAARSDAPDLSFSGKELGPLVKAFGNTGCRMVKVSVLDAAEVDELSEALAPILSKYFGESINRYGPEVALIGVTLKVAMPRVQEAAERRKAAKLVSDAAPHDASKDAGSGPTIVKDF